MDNRSAILKDSARSGSGNAVVPVSSGGPVSGGSADPRCIAESLRDSDGESGGNRQETFVHGDKIKKRSAVRDIKNGKSFKVNKNLRVGKVKPHQKRLCRKQFLIKRGAR